MKSLNDIRIIYPEERVEQQHYNHTGEEWKLSTITFINEWGDFGAKVFGIGREYGLEAIITAQNETDALEAWLDEQPTVSDEDELRELEEYSNDHDGELMEGYQYQANFTGSGIVAVGHHLWISELTPIVTFKEKGKK